MIKEILDLLKETDCKSEIVQKAKGKNKFLHHDPITCINTQVLWPQGRDETRPQLPAPGFRPEKHPHPGTKSTNLLVSPGRSLALMLMLQRNGLTVSFILRLTWPQRTCTTTLSRVLLVGC